MAPNAFAGAPNGVRLCRDVMSKGANEHRTGADGYRSRKDGGEIKWVRLIEEREDACRKGMEFVARRTATA